MEKSTDIKVDDARIAQFRRQLCVPIDKELGQSIMEEAHSSKFSIHSKVNKAYQDLKCAYWWMGMKMNVEHFIYKCMTCQQVKAWWIA